MSHEATNWAIRQRGLKPAAKVVLWHLADRFHPDNGCFPSQETLARDCELSRSALNEHLAALESAGLIRREQRRDERTNRQRSTCYRFAFEGDFAVPEAVEDAQKPCPETGHGAVSGNGAEPCPENAESRVRNPDTNPVREPVREPLGAQAREREPENGIEDRKTIERAFERAFRAWPTSIGDSRPDALKAWMGLSADERGLAASEAERYIAAAKATGRSHTCSHAVYLREKRWEGLAPREPDGPQMVEARPFGKAWMAERLRRLLAGPTMPIVALTNFEQVLIREGKADAETLRRDKQAKTGFPFIAVLDERAGSGRGATVPARLEGLAGGFEPVRVGGERWEEWKLEHALRGWPWLPDSGRQEWAYFPAGGPDGLKAFEQSIRGGVAAEAAE